MDGDEEVPAIVAAPKEAKEDVVSSLDFQDVEFDDVSTTIDLLRRVGQSGRPLNHLTLLVCTGEK